MKANRLLLVVIILLLGIPTEAQENTLRVFLIGNSFSQNATRYLSQIAKEKGFNLSIGRAELGGCSLQRHWDSVEVNIQDSLRGRPYKGKSLKELLSGGKWDIITIQQFSFLSGDEETFQPYAKNLFDFIKALQPQAEVVVHQTWPYRADAKSFGKIRKEERASSQKEMWRKSRAAYHKLAKDLGGLRVIPVGDAFYTVAIDERWSFEKDDSFDFQNAFQPQLPKELNSLNVGYTWKNGKLRFDPNHANAAGCYLAGLIWYGFLFNENPEEISFIPKGVPDDFAGFLRKKASEISKLL